MSSNIFCSVNKYPDIFKPLRSPEPVFVGLLRSPGIDSQPGGPKRQNYLSYRPAKLHRLAESIPLNRFLSSINVYKYGLRSPFQGIDSVCLFSLASWYGNPIPTRYLASKGCSKIPAQLVGWSLERSLNKLFQTKHCLQFEERKSTVGVQVTLNMTHFIEL